MAAENTRGSVTRGLGQRAKEGRWYRARRKEVYKPCKVSRSRRAKRQKGEGIQESKRTKLTRQRVQGEVRQENDLYLDREAK